MYVQSLEIENIKGFGPGTRFDFSQGDENSMAGWTVLVGGNASGKTTVLKLIALALIGPDQARDALRGDLNGWIKDDNLEGKVVATIAYDQQLDRFPSRGNRKNAFAAGLIWQRKSPAENVLRLEPVNIRERNTSWASIGPWNSNSSGWFCAGYGPWRRLSGSSADAVQDASSQGAMRRLVTLFREDASLSFAEEWLKRFQFKALEQGTDSPARAILDRVKDFLNDGLLPDGFVLSEINSDQVFVAREGLSLPMRDISDGCRSVLALVLDLVRHFSEVFPSGQLFEISADGSVVIDKPGVVLIDEVESHLHPSWQRDLPVWLTRKFPRVQFIVSTHSPLIAQSADSDGIFVLPLPGETDRLPRKLSTEEADRIRSGRAEKTLLGAAFGLKSTRSRKAVEQIRRFQLLNGKSKAAGLSEDEAKELKHIKQELQTQFDFEDQLDENLA
jgi:ABC-type polar amino acid transport system ATPase subunit